MDLDEVRVVVVDDVQDEAAALAAVLDIDGYKVRVSLDGHDALAVIEDYRPHCVLLDIDMPGMNGCELSRQLRQRYGDEMVLIAVSGWGEEDLALTKAFECMDHYLRKPVEPALLRQLLPPLTGD